MTSSLPLSTATYADRDALLELKCRIFDGVSLENEVLRWEWEFRDNPASDPGIPFCRYYRDDQGMAGSFSFVPHRILIDQHVRYGAAAIDLSVDPRCRGQGLGRKLSAELWTEGFCDFAFGTGTNAASLHMFTQLGATLLGGPREQTAYAYFIADQHPAQPTGPALAVRETTSFGAEQDDLFAAICRHHSLLLVKDARYMNWRYRDYPFTKPTLLQARDGQGRVRGTAVVQTDERHNRMFLLDLLAEPQDDEALRGLLRAVVEIANGTAFELLYYSTRAPLELPLIREFDFRPVGGELPTYICKLFGFARQRGVHEHHWCSALGDGDQLYNAGEPESP